MDISFGNVAFGVTCPGVLMQQLQRDNLEHVCKIKVLQTSFSRGPAYYQCPVGCGDLNIVKNFVDSIDALEELSVLNYEFDVSLLWQAIFHHSESMTSLAIHTPPPRQLDTWTTSTVKQIHERLLKLRKMELDISLEEAESFLIKEENPLQLFTIEQQAPSIMDELVKMDRLESVTINVNLHDASSAFADRHTWNAYGSISFPSPNKENCKQLAQQIYHAFHANTIKSSLTHVHLRFPRLSYEDRCQFWTVAYSVHVKVDEGELKVVEQDSWKEYMPPPPPWGDQVFR